jgi:hypothetical protein
MDVLLLAIITTVFVQITKLTIFKKIQKKILTFLPFGFGIVLYAIYAGVYHRSFLYITTNYVDIVEHGFSVGTASTLAYVMYEQFIRNKSEISTTEGVVAALIAGYVPTNQVEETAKQIAQTVSTMTSDATESITARISEILTENAENGITECDITLLSKLIMETLNHLSSDN